MSIISRIKKGERLSPLTEFKKGQKPWNYGKAKKYICRICKEEFKNNSHGKPKYCSKKCMKVGWKLSNHGKGHLGEKFSEKRRKQMSKDAKKLQTWKVLFEPEVREKAQEMAIKAIKGKPSPLRGKKAPWAKGKNNFNWKGGVSSQSRIDRKKFEWLRKEVLARDNYTCQICGKRGGKLHVDHIQSWAEYVELRFNIENCRTLCIKCHYEITFGKPISEKGERWGNKSIPLKEVQSLRVS